LTRGETLKAFDRIRVWQQGDKRAVHKPLLVLLELARIAQGSNSPIEFIDLEPKMARLLEEFGRTGSATTRHYPFWHLQTDGIWQLEGPEAILDRPAGATPTLTELRNNHVAGQFTQGIRQTLAAHPELVHEIARRIVDAHFPESIRDDVLEAVGLPVTSFQESGSQTEKRRRDPAFREKVLLAYEYRCCVCGHDLRLGRQVIGLEAAHIKWFQAGGPDIETNGLALCSLHHKIFDLGAFTVLPNTYEMVFSRHVVGSPEIQSRLLSYHGAGLIQPQGKEFMPSPEFLEWHRKEVFKEPARG
jgi:putative restriction endonuclease